LTQPQHPYMYLPLSQNPRPRITLHVRTAGAPMAISAAVRGAIREASADLPAYNVRPLAEYVDRSIAQPRYASGAVSLDRQVGRAVLSLGATHLQEQATVLGARFSPTIGVGGGASWFADAGASFDLGRGWDASAAYRRGWTAVAGGGGLAQGGRLVTDAWTLDFGKSNALRAGDRFALRLMQPLRVRSGGFDLSVPVSYSYDTLTAGYEDRFFNLAPTGREIDLEAGYGLDLFAGSGHLSANAFARRDPGNVAAMKDDLGAAIRFTLGF